LYATYQKSFEKFGYSVGLRGESAFTKGYLVTLDSFVSNEYFKIYPTLHLSYQLKENKELQLNYSKRVNRPEGDELNPFPEYQDPAICVQAIQNCCRKLFIHLNLATGGKTNTFHLCQVFITAIKKMDLLLWSYH
jgi:hypothetical protein